jgi:hypothetical protein
MGVVKLVGLIADGFYYGLGLAAGMAISSIVLCVAAFVLFYAVSILVESILEMIETWRNNGNN